MKSSRGGVDGAGNWPILGENNDEASIPGPGKYDRPLGGLLLVLWAAATLLRYWGNWSIDLSALYFAGLHWDSGQGILLYNPGNSPPWRALAAELGAADRTLAPYIYPPWVAGLIAPVARAMEPQAFFNLGYVVHIASIAGSVALAARIAGGRVPFWLWAAVSVALLETSFVAQLTLDLNQPQNLVNLAVLGAIVLSAQGRGLPAGGLLALATLVKLTPAIFVLVFLVRRDWRAIAAFAATAAALGGLGWVLSPPEFIEAYRGTLDRLGSHILLSRISHALETLIYLIWAIATGGGDIAFHGYRWVAAPPWIAPLSQAVLLTGIATGYMAARGTGGHGLWFQTLFTALWLAFAGPMGWTHYLMLPMLLLPGLLALLPLRKALLAVFAACLPFFFPLFSRLTAMDLPEHTSMLWGMFWQAVLLAGLYLLARRQPRGI